MTRFLTDCPDHYTRAVLFHLNGGQGHIKCTGSVKFLHQGLEEFGVHVVYIGFHNHHPILRQERL